jgi:hypothetical protein
MTNQKNSFVTVTRNSVIAITVCLLVGMLFNGIDVFKTRSTAFEFVVYGTLSSLFFFVLKVSRRDSLALLLVLLFVNIGLVSHSFRTIYFMRDILYFAADSVSVYLFFTYFYREGKKSTFLMPLLLASFLGIAFDLSWSLLHFLRGGFRVFGGSSELFYFLYIVGRNGFLIGLGVGLGILVVDLELWKNPLRLFRRS